MSGIFCSAILYNGRKFESIETQFFQAPIRLLIVRAQWQSLLALSNSFHIGWLGCPTGRDIPLESEIEIR
jgi:hypothetical protein